MNIERLKARIAERQARGESAAERDAREKREKQHAIRRAIIAGCQGSTDEIDAALEEHRRLNCC